MPVYIGLLMLMGIVTKNAIMLVDFAVERVKHGMSRHDAIIDAGRKRARPIIMTTHRHGRRHGADGARPRRWRRVPRADGDRGDRRPDRLDLAVSLVFVPSAYSVMDDLTRLFSWMFGRFVGPKDEEAEAAPEPVQAFGKPRVVGEPHSERHPVAAE